MTWTSPEFVSQMFADLGGRMGPSGFMEHVQFVRGPGTSDDDPRYALAIYTDRNRYSLTIVEATEEQPEGYLGCVASSRKPRAGEDWHRGNDLPDGPLNHDTWTRILAGILGYELVRVQNDGMAETGDIAVNGVLPPELRGRSTTPPHVEGSTLGAQSPADETA